MSGGNTGVTATDMSFEEIDCPRKKGGEQKYDPYVERICRQWRDGIVLEKKKQRSKVYQIFLKLIGIN